MKTFALLAAILCAAPSAILYAQTAEPKPAGGDTLAPASLGAPAGLPEASPAASETPPPWASGVPQASPLPALHPKPVAKPSAAPVAATKPRPTHHGRIRTVTVFPENSAQLLQNIHIRELKTQALEDPAVKEENAKANAARTSEGRRVLRRNYYTLLYTKMEQLDPALHDALENQLFGTLYSLEQHRVRPSPLVERVAALPGSRSEDHRPKPKPVAKPTPHLPLPPKPAPQPLKATGSQEKERSDEAPE